MRALIASIAMMIGAALGASPAQACLSHEIYPAYWNQQPLFPRDDEIILRVELVGRAVLTGPEPHTTCSDNAYVFKVVEVLRGSFSGPEIALTLPIAGELFDSPRLGERRIVVGKIQPAVQLSERWDDRREIDALIASGVKPADAPYLANSSIVGGPSTLPALAFRAPFEAYAVMLLSHPSVWAYLILPALGIGGVGIAVWRVLARRRSRP